MKEVIPRQSNEKMESDGRSPLDRDAYCNRNALRKNGEKLSGDGEAGLHPAFLSTVMQLRDIV